MLDKGEKQEEVAAGDAQGGSGGHMTYQFGQGHGWPYFHFVRPMTDQYSMMHRIM